MKDPRLAKTVKANPYQSYTPTNLQCYKTNLFWGPSLGVRVEIHQILSSDILISYCKFSNEKLMKLGESQPLFFIFNTVRILIANQNSELMVPYSNGRKLNNQTAFGYQNFYHGRLSNGLDHSISNYLNTKQVKVSYSDMVPIQMFAIQIPTVPNCCSYIRKQHL